MNGSSQSEAMAAGLPATLPGGVPSAPASPCTEAADAEAAATADTAASSALASFSLGHEYGCGVDDDGAGQL